MSGMMSALIYNKINSGELTKAEAARMLAVSPRTIGRWYASYHDEVQNLEEDVDDSNWNDVFDPYYGDDAEDDSECECGNKYCHCDEVEPETEYRVIASKRSISVTKVVDDRVESSITIDSTSPLFDRALTRIKEEALSQEVLAEVFIMAQPAKMIESFTEGQIRVDVPKNKIYFISEGSPDYEINGLLSSRVIDVVSKDGVAGAKSLINFMNKLLLNPSNRAVIELYGFLEHNDIEITQDGNFLAWKRVRGDYMDCYTGTFDNSVGQSPRVPRNMVDEDSTNTCSYGLHVCAKHYIGSFYGDKVVQVEVDPADVCAVPADYLNAKLRCSGYTVVADVTEMFEVFL